MASSISHTAEIVRGNRSLAALGIGALLAELGYAVLNLSALPMYVKFSLKLGPVWGLILATFLLAEALSKPPLGALGDRIGRIPLLIAGPAVTAVTSYLTITLHGPYIVFGLVALRAIDGVGSGALWANAFAAVGDIVDEKNRSTAMSVMNVRYMTGLALAFLAGGAVNEHFGSYKASFYLASILMILAVFVMLAFGFRRFSRNSEERKIDENTGRAVYGEPMEVPTLEDASGFRFGGLLRSFKQFPEMMMLACVVFLGIGIMMPIVKWYAVEHLAMSERQFGVAVAPVAATMGLFAVPLGRLGDKFGKCAAVSWGLLGSALAMWVIALFRSITLAIAGGAALGLGFTVAFPAWMALVASATSSSRRGEVLGAVGMAQGLAAIVGSGLGAFVYSSDLLSFPRLGVVNYNVPFWFSAILLSIGAVTALTWVNSRHCHKDPSEITSRQRNLVLAAALAGLVCLSGWVGYRYTRPVQPDRVAWLWVQQLVRGRPDKAEKYAVGHFGAWDGPEASRKAARRFSEWEREEEARYTVLFPTRVTRARAEAPVKFTFPDRKIIERVFLCRRGSGEWKVCGLRSKR